MLKSQTLKFIKKLRFLTKRFLTASLAISMTVPGLVVPSNPLIAAGPAVEPVPVQTVTVGTPLSFKVSATDADGDALSFLLGANAPVNAMIDSGGIFSWTPTATGTFLFDILVSDISNIPDPTGALIENRNAGPDGRFGTEDDIILGGMATLAAVKSQARDLLGIELDDYDALDLPLLATDPYGNFVPGPRGYPQLVLPDETLVEGNLDAPVDASSALRSGHAFLVDIAHSANPVNSRGQLLVADSDDIVGLSEPGTFDNELLDAHYIAGDGRVNENISLTAVHHILHSEHNRLVEHAKEAVLATGDPAFLNEWLKPGTAPVVFPATAEEIARLDWNGQRLFQVAKFGTEMQYQHLVFEEFARRLQPGVNLFSGYHADIDPAIAAEFAHTVYRFGHSMLTETVDRVLPDGRSDELSLLEAFLNPLEFAPGGMTPDQATGALVRGLTRQVGNEIDEFVTETLRNSLLGLPLDLPAINLARGRDTGIPSLNAARRQFFNDTGDSILRPYSSWAEFSLNIKHPESLINFIAAYGTHPSVVNAINLADKRTAAALLVLGGEGAPADRLDLLNSTGAWSNSAGRTTTGLDDVDFWIGGLAEEKMPVGGMLGPTFNFVFEMQMEKLQDGDRFYYLSRTAGLNFLTQLEENSFAELIMRNSDARHLPGSVFLTPAYTFEAGNLRADTSDPAKFLDDPSTPYDEHELLIRKPDGSVAYSPQPLTSAETVTFGGTEGDDRIQSGAADDDTLWGDGGDDRLDGGAGNDNLFGGDGDDILTDPFGDDVIKGGNGSDVLSGGAGLDLLFGGNGNDFIIHGNDGGESFGGTGNDFILGGPGAEIVFGGEGDDWIEGGTGADLLQGDNGDPFQLSTIIGNDVIMGTGNDDYDMESGDDIGVMGLGTQRVEGMLGFDWAIHQGDSQPGDSDLNFSGLLPAIGLDALRDRFDLIEGVSGWDNDDVLRGDNREAIDMIGHELKNIALIDGLGSLLGTGVDQFTGGNIILGGAGSDRIEGRGGNDIIDGDAWLKVRLSVRDANNHSIELRSANSLNELRADMLAGLIKPNQIKIIREILVPDDTSGDIDTAIFSGLSADYTVSEPDAFGRITVTDNRALVNPGGGGDNNINGRFVTDGTDTLRNIERLQFADISINLPAGFNAVAAPVLSGLTPVSEVQNSGIGAEFIRNDLDFILAQIKIAEAHANGVPLKNMIPDPTVHWGIRTVDGAFNNIVPGQSGFGAADLAFPRLLAPEFKPAENVTIDLDGPGPLTVGDETSYAQTSGFVFDSEPRKISNLIADQTSANPAAVAAAYGATAAPGEPLFIPNVAPDFGLTTPFNSWMTYFGQFFDHGLDLVKKGGSGLVFMPLAPDDPLFNPASPQTNFMVLERATNLPGPDEVLGTADDIHEHTNKTTPFVDQNQTYGSHASQQVFLRAYEAVPNPNGSTVTVPVTVIVEDAPFVPVLSSIDITPASLDLNIGLSRQLTARGFDQNGELLAIQPDFTWESSDPIIATVSETGQVEGLSFGITEVTTLSGNFSATATVAVIETPVCETGADADGDGIISNLEILNHVRAWRNAAVGNLEILRAIVLWKAGSGC